MATTAATFSNKRLLPSATRASARASRSQAASLAAGDTQGRQKAIEEVQGPPPVPMCTPFPGFPTVPDMDSPRQGLLENLPCDEPIWSPTASGRFIRGLGFSAGSVAPDSLRSLHANGAVEALAEVTNQYRGIAPDHPRMDPYWALAEELDLPVGIHMGPGPPGVAYMRAAGYRAHLSNPLALEDLLALLYAHPQVHVGIGVIVYTQPREAFYRYLQRLVEAGFANRIMFGSDQMVWPETLEIAIEVMEDASFLTDQQRRDILYNNAARFLELTTAQIDTHHSG